MTDVRKMDSKQLLEEALKVSARLCLIRNDVQLEEDTCTEEEAAEDAAWACFGEGTCSEDPIPEVTELLRRLAAQPDPEPVVGTQIEPFKSDNPWHLFHHLWTKAVGTAGYIKQEWRDIEAVLVRAKVEAPVSRVAGTASAPDPKKVAREIEKWMASDAPYWKEAANDLAAILRTALSAPGKEPQ